MQGNFISDPAEKVPDLPEALRRFSIRACRRDPAKRYQKVAEAMDDLRPLAKDLGLASKDLFMEKQKIATLFLIYKYEHQLALNELMEEFSTQEQNLAIVPKMGEFKDL